jgi:poly(ADP-ribose) glycohydrolase
MSQQQAACLLANAFFCTFPNRSKRNSDYPEINFNRLFCSEGSKIINKLKCILNYFRAVLLEEMPTGVLTFQRRYLENLPDWSRLDDKFSNIKWHINSKGTIEEGRNMLQVDFANRYLGGGVLGTGCVQEEIRFMINPECIVGMLFCESMKAEEAIYIYGSEQVKSLKFY